MSALADPLTAGGAAPAARGPYKFLDYFAEDEGDRFFGRSDDIDEVAAGIAGARAFVVYGPSGTGKTSLLRAGVARALRRRGFIPVYARVRSSPVDDLRAEVARALGDPDPGKASLRDLLARLARGGGGDGTRPVVVIFDQFEELFIRWRSRPAERHRFADVLAALLRDDALDVRVAFSLREDYLAELDAFRAAAPDLLDHRYRLSALTAFGAREAIARPLMTAGIDCAPRLIDRLVDRIAELGFDPAMLQIVCSEVYKEAVRRGGEPPRLEEQDLAAIGDVDGIFRRYLDRVTERIPAEQHLLARSVLDALITVDRTKRAVTMASLLQASFLATEEELAGLVEVLVEQRLVRRELRGDETWFELVHDRLVAIVLEWLESDLDFFQFRAARELVQDSSRGEFWRRSPEVLLNEGQVDGVVGPYKTRLRLSALELEFVLRSAVYRGAEDAGYWGRRQGPERSEAIVRELMASDDPAVRLNVARAAPAFSDPGGALAAAYTDAALGDPSIEVRRAAGRALATLAGPAELQRLREALRGRAGRRAALEVFADLAGEGMALRELPWRRRRQARSLLAARRTREHAQAIRDRGRRGAVRGFVMGLAWTVSVGLALAFGALWGSFGSSVLTSVYFYVVGVAALPLVGGAFALLGWWCNRANARQAVIRGEERWVHALVHPGYLAAGLACWAVASMSFALLNILAIPLAALLGPAGAMLLLLPLVALPAHLVQLRRAEQHGRLRDAAWALVAAIGAPLLVPSLALAALGGDDAWSMVLEIVAWMWSAATAAVTFALGAPGGRLPAPAPVPAGKARAARALLLAALAGTAARVAWRLASTRMR